ncbi:MAG: ChaN family lipoprotein [Thermoguttaceae bacterium]|jgi:uncharacterized iron-regulated protein
MKTIPTALSFAWLLAILASLPGFAPGAERDGRCRLWIDVYRGEPLAYEDVLDDLAGAGVVYLGEFHTLAEHHAVEEQVLSGLAKRGKSLVLGMEQLEAQQQPAVDRYNRGEISFEQLAEELKWRQSWGNYQEYKLVVEAARKFKIPILALNARAATIRQVRAGGGIERLDAKLRGELPKEMQSDDPLYAKLLNLQLMVHMAASPKVLRPWIEAQIARDETMAATLCAFLRSEAGRGRSAVVICGAGHVSYGLGTPARVRRRMPRIKDRIVLLSASGDLQLSPAEVKAARAITVTHEQLRQIDRPIGDYLRVTSAKKEKQ